MDLKKILHSLGSDERGKLEFVFDIATGRSWQENHTGLRKAKQSWEENKQKLEATIATRMAAQMNFRIMEFKQKDEVEREVARRISMGVDRARANREVFNELLMLLDIMNQCLFHRWKEYLWVLKIARCWRERFRVLASTSKEINNQCVRWYAVGLSER
jgi:hypothetical protein